MWKSCNSFCAGLVFLGAATAFATQAPLASKSPAETNKTTITSQRLTVRNQDNKAIFEGMVVLTKGELVVHSDMMVVFFKPADSADTGGRSETPRPKTRDTTSSEKESPGKGGELPVLSNRTVSLIEATGRVRIVKADGQATCRKAVYHGDEDKIVLTGDPVAWQKGTKVSGEKITMYLAEERSVVEGQSRVMIEPEGSGR
jgi:lipopolysaccharide export system protein LptA